jgi:phosphate transport system substrate-binding protein
MARARHAAAAAFSAALGLSLLNPFAVFAQDTASPVTAAGSGIVTPVVEAVGGEAVAVTVTGTDQGIQQVCAGQVDLALTNRALTADEEANCTTNGVAFYEQLIGYNAIALVSSPNAAFNVCFTLSEISNLFTVASSGVVIDWLDVNPANPPGPIALYVPPSATPAFGLLDSLVIGDGVRPDATTADDDAIIAAVAADPSALGVVSLPAALAAGDAVRLHSIDNSTTGCAEPSVESVESRAYLAASNLYAYVNAEAIASGAATALIAALTSSEADTALAETGLVAPSEAARARNAAAIAETTTGRLFTRDVTAFTIPPNLFGVITVAGTSNAFDLIQSLTTAFTTPYSSVTISSDLAGQPEGVRRFCNGEVDIVLISAELTDEQVTLCRDNNAVYERIELGAQAVVLLANGSSEYAHTLSVEQIARIFAAAPEAPNTWNQVDTGFPEAAITLVLPQTTSAAADLLLTAAGSDAPLRVTDLEQSDDPLYRATAVSNIEGALTFMSWNEYQTAVQNSVVSATLVAVGTGETAVTPDARTIGDGSYPLAQPLAMLVRQSALARPEVQSLMWFLFSDASFSLLTNNNLYGIEFGSLTDRRYALQQAFDAATAALQTVAEATPEATAETTPAAEATETAEAAATAETTTAAEATAEAEPDATPAATATAETTATATAEATAGT